MVYERTGILFKMILMYRKLDYYYFSAFEEEPSPGQDT